MHHIAFSHDVFLALKTQLSSFFSTLLALQRDVVIKADHFRADESSFEIGMNDTGRLRRSCTLFDRPGTNFFDARGEIGLQSEQGVTGANHAIETRLLETQIFEELGTISIIELRNLSLDRRANRHHLRALTLRKRLDGS